MAKQAWFSKVKSEFVKSPLASNVVFSSILTVLEKLVEMEFVCPCDSKRNKPFTILLFVVPAVLAFLLMINIQGYKKNTWSEWGKNVLFSVGPAIVWVILMFFDGQYFVCAKTDWSGRFVSVPEAGPWKWCEPANHTSSSGDELKKTLLWFSQSQGIGMWIVIILTILLGLYVLYMVGKSINKMTTTEYSLGRVEGSQHPEESVRTTGRRTTDS